MTAEKVTGFLAGGFSFPLEAEGLFQQVITQGETTFLNPIDKLVTEASPEWLRPHADRLVAPMMQASLPGIHTDADPIGWMRLEVWKGMRDMLMEHRMLEEAVEIDAACTVQCLQAVCGGSR